MKREVLILQSSVTERMVRPGDIGQLSADNSKVRVGGNWFDFDARWNALALAPGHLLDGKELDGDDIGRKVIYVPSHAFGDVTHTDCEVGTLMHWNKVGAMIDYGRNKQRTNYEDLRWFHAPSTTPLNPTDNEEETISLD